MSVTHCVPMHRMTGAIGVATGVAVASAVAVLVGRLVCVAVALAVAVRVLVDVASAVAVRVTVVLAVAVPVRVGVLVGVDVAVCVAVPVLVAVCVAVRVAVLVRGIHGRDLADSMFVLEAYATSVKSSSSPVIHGGPHTLKVLGSGSGTARARGIPTASTSA